MAEPTRRGRISAEDIAVPQEDLVGDLIEALGEVAAMLIRNEPAEARPERQAPPTRPERSSRPQPNRGLPRVLQYPRIDYETPLGPSPDNPMGEGSEETAVPVIDPVDVRLGQVPTPPEVPR
jgi:hypothetical protein